MNHIDKVFLINRFKSRKNLVRDLNYVIKFIFITNKISESLVRRFYPKFIPYRGKLTWSQYLAFLIKVYDPINFDQSKMFPPSKVYEKYLETNKHLRMPLIDQEELYIYEIKRKFWIPTQTLGIKFLRFHDDKNVIIFLNNHESNVPITILPNPLRLILLYFNYSESFLKFMTYEEFLWLLGHHIEYNSEQISEIIKINKNRKLLKYLKRKYPKLYKEPMTKKRTKNEIYFGSYIW